MKLFFFFSVLILSSLHVLTGAIVQEKNNSTRSVVSRLPLSEVSKISKIATKYVSGANIPEVVNKPNRRAKISVLNNYKSAMLRRQMWSEVLKTASEPVIGYNITISEYYYSNPPPVQAFMKSELPVEINSQCLNAFNYFYVYPNLLSCTPSPSKELLEVLFRYICLKSVLNIFKVWTGSIFILRDIIEKTLFFVKLNKIPQSVLNSLMSEYYLSPFKDFVPVGGKIGKHVNTDIEGQHIWQFIVNRSRLLYSIDSPTRAPRRGEWAFVLVTGNPTPQEFLYMRGIRFINTDSVQLITAVLFTMILFKLKNPSQFNTYDILIEDYRKKLKKSVNSNLLLAFAARIANDYAYISNDWNDQIDTLLEIDLEEKEKNQEQTFIWNSKPLVSLAFEPDITIPNQLISNCVKYCEDLVSRGVVTVVGANNEGESSSFLQKKLENICVKLQKKILPYTEIYVESDKTTPNSILKTPTKPSDPNKKRLRFNNNVQVSVYEKNGMVGERTPVGSFPLGASLKTSLVRQEGSSTAKPEIPTESKKLQTVRLDELDLTKIDHIDSNLFQKDDLFDKTPYPLEDGGPFLATNSSKLKLGNSTETIDDKISSNNPDID